MPLKMEPLFFLLFVALLVRSYFYVVDEMPASAWSSLHDTFFGNRTSIQKASSCLWSNDPCESPDIWSQIQCSFRNITRLEDAITDLQIERLRLTAHMAHLSDYIANQMAKEALTDLKKGEKKQEQIKVSVEDSMKTHQEAVDVYNVVEMKVTRAREQAIQELNVAKEEVEKYTQPEQDRINWILKLEQQQLDTLGESIQRFEQNEKPVDQSLLDKRNQEVLELLYTTLGCKEGKDCLSEETWNKYIPDYVKPIDII